MITARSENPPSPIKRPELSAARRAGAARLVGLLMTGMAGSGEGASSSSSIPASSTVSPLSSKRAAKRSFLRRGDAKENSSSGGGGDAGRGAGGLNRVGGLNRAGGLTCGRVGIGGRSISNSGSGAGAGSGSGKSPATPTAGIGAGRSVHQTMSWGDRLPLEASVTSPWCVKGPSRDSPRMMNHDCATNRFPLDTFNCRNFPQA